MKRLRTSLTIIAVFAFHLTSCLAFYESLLSTPEPRGEWLIDWMEDPVCEPPCYKQIIPGKTTLEEAHKYLLASPEVNIYDFFNPDTFEHVNRGQLIWGYENSNDGGWALTFLNKLIVSHIELSIDEGVFIREIIEIYGPPSHVWFSDCRAEILYDLCSIDLVYIGMGFSIGLPYREVFGKNATLKIKGNQVFRYIYFFPPGMDGFCSSISDCNEDDLTEWKGYGAYPVKR